MKIIVGLGNPGFRYRNTRHNAGFLVLKQFARDRGLAIKKKGFGGVYGTGRVEGQECLLFEPMTYMNLSGGAVKGLCSAKLDDMKDLLVVTDDLSLPLGSLRLREKGSAGGHNGLKSVIAAMGTDFARLRVGIGLPAEEADISGYVLSAFPRKERAAFLETVEKAAGCVGMWVSKGAKETMNLYNPADVK
jgi:peptidyl-tRNA hydrolase, PTH1 family